MSEAKTDYVLVADGTTVFDFNERGDLIFKKRYNKGDVVPLTEGQAAGLLRHGSVVKPEDATADTADDAGAPAPDASDEVDDGYDEMSYPVLQRLAKERTGNGGGSTEELIERLREHDAAQA